MRRKERILIVDDDETFVRFEERLLEDRYTLSLTSSGIDALDVLPRFVPDLVLLDINMPEMDGYETCRRIRKVEVCKFTKIFMVSGNNSIEERLEAYNCGVDEYVAKPYNCDEFLAKIQVFLRLRHIEEIERIKSSLLSLLSSDALEPSDRLHRLIHDLSEDEETPDHLRQYLGPILRNASDLNQLAEKAARLHQLECGLPLSPYRDTLNDHLTFVMQRLEPSAAQKKMSMVLQCAGHIAFRADWKALDEVFGYILENAIRYSGAGGNIEIFVVEDLRECHIRIQDNGKGIEQDRLPSIFTSFAVDDLDHHHEGQRLSLAIAKQLVELHHGTIKVESTPGAGTAFFISLPLIEEGLKDSADGKPDEACL